MTINTTYPFLVRAYTGDDHLDIGCTSRAEADATVQYIIDPANEQPYDRVELCKRQGDTNVFQAIASAAKPPV